MKPSDHYLGTTTSLCAVCGRLLPARIHVLEEGVWFHKHCPEHGPEQVRVHSDAKAYLKLSRYHRRACVPARFSTDYAGCPDSCGLCPEHEQHVCMPILEITDHCDLHCPICLVQNRSSFHRTRSEVARMLDVLIASEGQIDVLNLSGGEPTTHPQFRDIVDECVSRKEIVRVSVSSNGLRLSREPDLLEYLGARNVIVSLQFDGWEEGTDPTLRGRSLLSHKLRLIQLCRERNVTMSLTATVAKDINDQEVARIAELLFSEPHVVSVMFQPAAYVGQGASIRRPTQAITIPDVIRNLDGAGEGTVSARDFSPLPCSHPACFSLAFYLRAEDGRYLPIKRLLDPLRYLDLIQNRGLFGTDAESFRAVTDAIYEIWSSPEGLSRDSQAAMTAIKRLIAAATGGSGYSPGQAFAAAERNVKSIFLHQFMDRHTFDLSRARKCCQVYLQPDGRLMPVCVYNCLKRGCA